MYRMEAKENVFLASNAENYSLKYLGVKGCFGYTSNSFMPIWLPSIIMSGIPVKMNRSVSDSSYTAVREASTNLC